jgi:hypothetical protein
LCVVGFSPWQTAITPDDIEIAREFLNERLYDALVCVEDCSSSILSFGVLGSCHFN